MNTGSGGTAGTAGSGGLIIQVPTDAGITSCAAAATEAQLRPVMLAFMLDRSGSMGGLWAPSVDPLRWAPVTAALKSFFAAPSSAGISASLQFFPLTDSSNNTMVCDVTAYQTPTVLMTPLPESTAFANAIDSNPPANHGGTPTVTAFKGTIPYVQGLSSSNPGTQMAVVLVTDGEPYDCPSGKTKISLVVAEIVKLLPAIPTYVIGVGNVNNLGSLATAGGTGTPFIVDVADPVQTQQQLTDAVNLIRGSAVPCDVDIPPPPMGQTLDPGLVNVQFTPVSGAPTTFLMSADCSGDQGWRYDDPMAPTRIQLCPGACQTVKAQFGGRLEVAFGCATQVF
jgi:hypothetical protein